MPERPKGRGFRRRKRGGGRRDLKPMEAAPPEWADLSSSEFGTRVWGEQAEPEETAPDATPTGPREHGTGRTSGSPARQDAPPSVAGPLREFEERITAEIHDRMDELASERRVILEGVRTALVSLGEGLNRRMDEIVGEKVASAGERLSGILRAELPTLTEAVRDGDDLSGQLDAVMEDLRRRIEAVSQELHREIVGLSEAIEAIPRPDDGARALLAADLAALRAAHAETTGQLGGLEVALTERLAEVRAGLAEAIQGLRDRGASEARDQRIDRLTEAVDGLRAAASRPVPAPRLDQLRQALEALQAKVAPTADGAPARPAHDVHRGPPGTVDRRRRGSPPGPAHQGRGQAAGPAPPLLRPGPPGPAHQGRGRAAGPAPPLRRPRPPRPAHQGRGRAAGPAPPLRRPRPPGRAHQGRPGAHVRNPGHR